jgi:hypothetical protein
MLHETFSSDTLAYTKIRRLLSGTATAISRGHVVADMLCLLRRGAGALASRPKAMLIAREAAWSMRHHPDARSATDEKSAICDSSIGNDRGFCA